MRKRYVLCGMNAIILPVQYFLFSVIPLGHFKNKCWKKRELDHFRIYKSLDMSVMDNNMLIVLKMHSFFLLFL